MAANAVAPLLAHRTRGSVPLPDLNTQVHGLLTEQNSRWFGDCDVSGIFTPNPHAAPGQPLHEAFRRSYAAAADKTIRVVFHGTSEANIGPISLFGLDPKLRKRQLLGTGDYFSAQFKQAVPYCTSSRAGRLLVFAILTDPSGITLDREDVVVVHKTAHQLPLGTVRFSLTPDQHGAYRAIVALQRYVVSLPGGVEEKREAAARAQTSGTLLKDASKFLPAALPAEELPAVVRTFFGVQFTAARRGVEVAATRVGRGKRKLDGTVVSAPVETYRVHTVAAPKGVKPGQDVLLNVANAPQIDMVRFKMPEAYGARLFVRVPDA